MVMWAPEGKTAVTGRAIWPGWAIWVRRWAVEGRWGQYMFPQIARLRGGMLVVQVYVGGDGPDRSDVSLLRVR